MKNAINYFYNFNIDNIRMIDDSYYFSFDNRNFIFQKINDLYFDYKKLIEINKSLAMFSKSFFQIIMNKDNNVITTVFNDKYILMLDTTSNDRQFDFYDLLNTNVLINYNKKTNDNITNNWSELWKNKVDYFENYTKNTNKKNKLNKYSSYFIALGEIAILYNNKVNQIKRIDKYDNPVVCHKRIMNNKSLKQLYNPLYLIIDHPSRDIAEYLKMLFFNNEIRQIEVYINSLEVSDYGAGLIISRMLFPSFFFDLLEKNFEDKDNEIELLSLIDKMVSYEKYISNIYSLLSKRYNIPEIKWLKKVDYSSTLITPNTSGISFTNIDSIPSLSVTSIMLQ